MSDQLTSAILSPDLTSSAFDVIPRAVELSQTLEALAVTTDRTSDYQQARDALHQSGLLALRVPREVGGEGGSQAQAIAVARILARADAGIAQLLQPHYGFTDTIALLASARARQILWQDVLNGERIANAASERGGKHSADFATTLVRQGDNILINGRKYYATGATGARWITVIGRNEQGGQVLAWVRTDAPGVTIDDDWNGLGQRGSASGSLILDNVSVPADYVLETWDAAHRGIAWHESGRLIHAAIDLGIAEGALAWGAQTVARDTRIPFESPWPTLAEDPLLHYQIGQLSARTRSVAALLTETAVLLDDVQGGNTARFAELQASLAASKALAAEVSLAVSSEVFSWSGARAADRALRLDRYWRNARTHTLHDPVRLRYQELGRHEIAQFAAVSHQESQP